MAIYCDIINGMTNGTSGDIHRFASDIIYQDGVVGASDLEVTESGTPDKYSNVGTGRIWVANSTGEKHSFTVDATVTTLHDDTSSDPRIDAVVFFADFNATSNANGSNIGSIEIVKGAESASPTAPSDSDITSELGASTWVRLANIDIANPFSSISTSDITDTRTFFSVSIEKGQLIIGGTSGITDIDDGIVVINTDDYEMTTGNPAMVVQGAANNERVHLKTYGSSANVPSFQGLSGRGTVESPTATQSGDALVQLRGDGIDNAGNETGSQGAVIVKATENFTTTNQGTQIVLATTPNTSTTLTNALSVKIGSAGNTTVTAEQGDLGLDVAANGDVVRIIKHPRRNHSSNTYVDSHIQSGWGYIQGDGTNTITGVVTLPIAYSSTAFRVNLTMCGYKNSVPTSEGDITGSAGTTIASYYVGSTSTFAVVLYHTIGTFSGSNYYMFSWQAIGPN